MITVSIWRKTLVKLGACSEGLKLFDEIAALQDEADPRRLKRIRVQWGPLAELWLARDSRGHVGWLRRKKVVPRIDLVGANLGGANLVGANLDGANLDGADLDLCDWERGPDGYARRKVKP